MIDRGSPPIDFITGTPYTIGVAPRDLAVADLDSDGVPDVAATASGSDDLWILVGVGGGALAPSTIVAISGSPWSLAVVDANRDGALDVVTSCFWSQELVVVSNDGGGGFTAGNPIALVGNPYAVATLDADHDGVLDVAVGLGGTSNGLVVFSSDGAGSYTVSSAMLLGDGVNALATGDLDLDGNTDLVLDFVTQLTVAWVAGDGQGGLGVPVVIDTTGPWEGNHWPYGVTIADVNGDGLPDLLTTNYSGNSATLLPGNGTGAFPAKVLLPAAFHPVTAAIGDLDADGDADLAFAGYGSGNVEIHFGTGSTAFPENATLIGGAALSDLVLSDMDGDGRPDVVVVDLAGDSVIVFHCIVPPPQGVSSFGSGTPGCHGAVGMSANGPLVAGAGGFAVTATNAPPSSVGLCLLADAADVAGADPFGIGLLLHLDLLASGRVHDVPLPSDASGIAWAPLAIPLGVPAGTTLYAQSFWIEAAAFACSANGLGVVSSKGLRIEVQP